MFAQFQNVHIQNSNYYVLDFIKLVTKKIKMMSIIIYVKFIFLILFVSEIIDMNVLFI